MSERSGRGILVVSYEKIKQKDKSEICKTIEGEGEVYLGKNAVFKSVITGKGKEYGGTCHQEL